MKTFIRLDGENIAAIVTSSIKPNGYIEIPEHILPDDLFSDMRSYKFDGVSFCKRVLNQKEERHKLSIELRISRDRKLSACDWTQVADAPVDRAAWAAYRQELRDITQQADFPNTVVWPVSP